MGNEEAIDGTLAQEYNFASTERECRAIESSVCKPPAAKHVCFRSFAKWIFLSTFSSQKNRKAGLSIDLAAILAVSVGCVIILAISYFRLEGKMESGKYDETIGKTSLILIKPDLDYRAYYREALNHYKKENFADAIIIFNKIIDDANKIATQLPLNILSSAYLYCGHSRYYQRDYRMAVEEYKNLIKIECNIAWDKTQPQVSFEKMQRLLKAQLYSSKANEARGYYHLAIKDCENALNFIVPPFDGNAKVAKLKSAVILQMKKMLLTSTIVSSNPRVVQKQEMGFYHPRSLSAPNLSPKAEVTEEKCIEDFLFAHKKLKTQEWFSWFRNSEIKLKFYTEGEGLKANMTLAEIITHAKKENNRSRKACVALHWMQKDGTMLSTAPTPVKRAYADSPPAPVQHTYKKRM